MHLAGLTLLVACDGGDDTPSDYLTFDTDEPAADCDDDIARPEKLYDEIWSHMDETYPYLDYKGIDWADLGETCRAEVCTPEDSYEDLIDNGLDCLLAPLRDYHVYVYDKHGDVYGYGLEGYTPNSDEALTGAYLEAGSVTQTAVTTTGTIGGTVGYIRVDTWSTSSLAGIDVGGLLDELPAVEGVIVDARTNNGGNEALAWELAGRFVSDTASPYDYYQLREEVDGDPATHELGPLIPHQIPASVVVEPVFDGPVAVLTGNRCISSCEAFVAMMKLAPNTRSFGGTTRGASGNPASVVLDDGETELYASTWQLVLADGETVLEWNGIDADEPVAFEGAAGDEVIEAALAWISGQ